MQPPDPCTPLPPHLLVGAVEVLHVVDVQVRRRDIGAATKPPLTREAVPRLSLKVPAEERRIQTAEHSRNNTACRYYPQSYSTRR